MAGILPALDNEGVFTIELGQAEHANMVTTFSPQTRFENRQGHEVTSLAPGSYLQLGVQKCNGGYVRTTPVGSLGSFAAAKKARFQSASQWVFDNYDQCIADWELVKKHFFDPSQHRLRRDNNTNTNYVEVKYLYTLRDPADPTGVNAEYMFKRILETDGEAIPGLTLELVSGQHIIFRTTYPVL